MPRGELYIKTTRMSASSDRTGIVTDEHNPFVGYADAFLRYGLSLSDGAIDKMMMEAPAKSAKGTSLVTRHGVSYVGATTGYTDERTLSLDVNILAYYRHEYIKRYRLLCDEVLCKEPGYVVTIRTRHEPDRRYRLLYQTMEQLRQWMTGGIGLMTLVFLEPHPELQLPIIPHPTITMTPKPREGQVYPGVIGRSQKFKVSLSESVTSLYTVSFESSDESKAIMTSSDGNSATFQYIEAGDVVITAELKYDNETVSTDTCNVKIAGQHQEITT